MLGEESHLRSVLPSRLDGFSHYYGLFAQLPGELSHFLGTLLLSLQVAEHYGSIEERHDLEVRLLRHSYIMPQPF